MDQPQVPRAGHLVDAGDEGADVAHAQLVLGPIAIAVEILAEGPQVEEEDGDVQARLVLLGQDRFLGGGHAADRRAVGVVAALVARADALDEGQPAGGLAVGRAADVAVRGTGGREHPLELQAGEHVGGQPVAELAAAGGVEGLETGREDHAADFQFELLDRLIVVDRAGLADLGAEAALAGREMDAVLAVDDRHAGRGLRMGQVDRGPALQVLGIAGLMQLGPPGADRRQVDRAGRADEDAGPAGLALIARLLESGAHAALAAAAEHADRAAGHEVVAGPHAQPAEDALAFGGLFQRSAAHAEFRGQLGQLLRLRGLGQQHLQHRPPRLPHGFRVGPHDQALFHRIAARGDLPRSSGAIDFHEADAARAVGRQAAIVAERGDRNAHLPRRVENRRVGRGGRRTPVDRNPNPV